MATTTSIPPLPPFHSLKPPPALTPSIAALTSTLGTLYRLTVSHTSRQFIGTFVCLDPQGNIVLDQAIEYELDEQGGAKGERREVGLVMVPRKWWTRIERVRTQEELEEEWALGEEERREELQQEGCRPSNAHGISRRNARQFAPPPSANSPYNALASSPQTVPPKRAYNDDKGHLSGTLPISDGRTEDREERTLSPTLPMLSNRS